MLFQPDYECIVEVIDMPTVFRMVISFAALPSPQVAEFLYGLSDRYPGVHNLQRRAEEVQQYLMESTSRTNRLQQNRLSSVYEFGVSNVYQSKSFGMTLAKHLKDEYQLTVKFSHWPNDNGTTQVYSPVRNL